MRKRRKTGKRRKERIGKEKGREKEEKRKEMWRKQSQSTNRVN